MANRDHKYAVILAGGKGSRFWPLSRSLEPKQFLPLHSDNSLFYDTVSRVKNIVKPRNIFVITNQLYFPEIFKYTSEFKIPRSNVVFEPEGKNTAPSVAIASHLIKLIDPEAKIVVLPSDHMVKKHNSFSNLLRFAFASEGLKNNLVIFGIHPDYPASGYGYIKVRKNKLQYPNYKKKQNIYLVERFIEKPDIRNAKKFFKNKSYFWNSGMFFGSVKVFLDEINNNIPTFNNPPDSLIGSFRIFFNFINFLSRSLI